MIHVKTSSGWVSGMIFNWRDFKKESVILETPPYR